MSFGFFLGWRVCDFPKRSLFSDFRIPLAAAALVVGVFASGQAQAARSTACQAIQNGGLNGTTSGGQDSAAVTGDIFAGEVLTISVTGTTLSWKLFAYGNVATTSSSASATYTFPTSANTTISFENAALNDVVFTVTCAAVASSASSSTSTQSAPQVVSAQLGATLPSGQIGNIIRRLDVALPAAPPALAPAPSGAPTPGGAPGGGTQQQQQSSSFAPRLAVGSRDPDEEESRRDTVWNRLADRRRIPGATRREQELGLVPVHLMFGDRGASTSARFGLDQIERLGAFAMALDGPATAQAPGPAGNRSDTPVGIPGQVGAKAAPGRFTLWGQAGQTRVANTLADAEYEGTARFYTLGADMRVRDNAVAGIAVGTSNTAITTYFNGGTYRETGITLSPYVAWRPSDRLSLQFVAGVARSTIDTMRSGAISGDTNARGWYVSATAAYRLTPDSQWRIEPRANLLVGKRFVDSFADSGGTFSQKVTTDTTRARVGGDVGYELRFAQATVEPFGRLEYIQDMSDTVNSDRTAFAATAGMRLLHGPTFGALEWEREFSRNNYFANTLSVILGYRFDLGEDKGTLTPSFSMGESGAFSRQGAGIVYAPRQGLDLSLTANSYTPNGRAVSVDRIGQGNLYVPANAKGASVYRAGIAMKF